MKARLDNNRMDQVETEPKGKEIRESGEKPLMLLSVVIPARDVEGCIGSTVEHLYVELRLRNVPHEIVVVDDGSTDSTWEVLQTARDRVPTLVPVKGTSPHGFGRAIVRGLDQARGDAAVGPPPHSGTSRRLPHRSGPSRHRRYGHRGDGPPARAATPVHDRAEIIR